MGGLARHFQDTCMVCVCLSLYSLKNNHISSIQGAQKYCLLSINEFIDCINKIMHQSMSSQRGEGGSSKPWEFDCDVYPQGGDFDHLIFQLQREEET